MSIRKWLFEVAPLLYIHNLGGEMEVYTLSFNARQNLVSVIRESSIEQACVGKVDQPN